MLFSFIRMFNLQLLKYDKMNMMCHYRRAELG